MRSFCMHATHLELTECQLKKLLDLHNQKWIQEHKRELYELQQTFLKKYLNFPRKPKNEKISNKFVNKWIK